MALLAGAFVFPLGVLLQTFSHGAFFASAAAILGSALVTIALGSVAWRPGCEKRQSGNNPIATRAASCLQSDAWCH